MHTHFVDKSPRRRRDGAGGRLKQRLAQILTRSSCTTNTTSAAAAAGGSGAATTTTAFVSLARAIAAGHQQEPAPPPSPYFCTPCTYERPPRGAGRRRRTRSASLVHISVDCTGGAVSGRRSFHSDAPLLQRRHLPVPARRGAATNGRRSGKGRGGNKPAARSPSSAASRRHGSSSSSASASWGRARRPRGGSIAAPCGWSSSSSSSSTATDDELAPFSSDGDGEGVGGEEEAETTTLLSSLSFSSDSTSELYYYHNATRRKRQQSRRNAGRAPRRALPPRTIGGGLPAPADVFRPLVVSVDEEEKMRGDGGYRNERKTEASAVHGSKTKLLDAVAAAAEEEEGGAGGGMAVVKRSSNPYLDFRSSMVEMVVERRIGSVAQMEELLGSYLSLNSPRHHPAILAAFEDVWEAVFGEE